MNIRGLLAGLMVGLLLTGRLPIAILGAIVGYWLEGVWTRRSFFNPKSHDKQAVQRKAIFVFSCFSTMGYIARGNGRITEPQIALAQSIMDEMKLTGDAKRDAQNAFNDGKKSEFDPVPWLQRLRSQLGNQPQLLHLFLDIQLRILDPHSSLQAEPLRRLQRVAAALKLSDKLNDRIKMWQFAEAFHRQQRRHSQRGQQTGGNNKDELANAYGVLGVSATCSDNELKKRYRKMVREHHPDKVAARNKDVGDAVLEQAKRRTQDINNAYQIIREARQAQK